MDAGFHTPARLRTYGKYHLTPLEKCPYKEGSMPKGTERRGFSLEVRGDQLSNPEKIVIACYLLLSEPLYKAFCVTHRFENKYNKSGANAV